MHEIIDGVDNTALALFCCLSMLFVILLYCLLLKVFHYFRPPPPPASDDLKAPPRIGTDLCPICMEHIKDEVEATCGHVYCAQCITTLWRSKGYEQLQCPYCRKIVNIFFE